MPATPEWNSSDNPIHAIQLALCHEIPLLTSAQAAEFFALCPGEKKHERIHRVRPILAGLVQEGHLLTTQTRLLRTELVGERPLWRKGEPEDVAAIADRMAARIPDHVAYPPARIYYATERLFRNYEHVNFDYTLGDLAASQQPGIVARSIAESIATRASLDGREHLSAHEILRFLLDDFVVRSFNLALLRSRRPIEPPSYWQMNLHQPCPNAEVITPGTGGFRYGSPSTSVRIAVLASVSSARIREAFGCCDELW